MHSILFTFSAVIDSLCGKARGSASEHDMEPPANTVVVRSSPGHVGFLCFSTLKGLQQHAVDRAVSCYPSLRI